jgi:hypothetical protein
MTLHTYDHLEQGSEEWLAARRGLITASVVGKLITPKTIKVAENDEARGLRALLVAERITGWSEPSYFNDDMQRGHDVEPIARDWYASKNNVVVDQIGFMVRDFNDGHRIGYSPDGLVGDDGLIEIKAPRSKAHLLTHVAGQMPMQHMAQVQTGLLVSSREWCDYISYCGGMPPFVQRIHADVRWFDTILAAVEQFEIKAAEMQAQYETKTHGLPTTERLTFDLEMTGL